MARHARTRSTIRPARPTRPAPCRTGRPRRTWARSRRCAPRTAPVPTLLGVITCEADFEELRRDGGTEYPAFADYLRDMDALLTALRRAGGAIQGRAFHPGDLVDYCDRWGLSIADPQSHTAYTADPAADAEWVHHDGEPLPEFLARLARARERGSARRRLERMLAETAEAAETGTFPEEPLRAAHAHAARALRRMLVGAAPGDYRIVCALRPAGVPADGPVEARADLRIDAGAVLRIEDGDLELLCSLLCTGFALGLAGSVLLAGECPGRGPVARGWDVDGTGVAPRNAADVLLDLSDRAAAWLAAGPVH
jgi:hypothetical protein